MTKRMSKCLSVPCITSAANHIFVYVLNYLKGFISDVSDLVAA